jgi:hypothetical protein
MSTQDDYLLEFIGILATLHKELVELCITTSKHPLIRETVRSVIPVKSQSSEDYADKGVLISLAVNAKLLEPKNRDKTALGVSLLLRRPLGVWVAEAEVGWTGASIGWDVFDSREKRAEQFSLLAAELPELMHWLSARFRQELADMLNR